MHYKTNCENSIVEMTIIETEIILKCIVLKILEKSELYIHLKMRRAKWFF